MTELPSGTVTFLFTDIERSTESAAALGDERWAEVLQVHRDLLRPCFASHNGVEVGTEGDAFFVAFSRADEAVGAAIDSQRALEGHEWSGETRVRVRMGMHTGEALVRADDYVGHDVHKAKRVCDAGHGGQILISQTTADIVAGAVTVKSLGPHRLKDLGEPQPLFQVNADGLQQKFPRLRSLEALEHNLPVQLTSFVGRERELDEARELLASTRLLTITGAGGSGKTRLALQLLAEILPETPGGVWLADLAPLTDASLVDDTVAEIITATVAHIAETSGSTGRTSVQRLIEHFTGRSAVLLLDNCEHVLGPSANLAAALLRSCSDLRIVVTTREPLGMAGETSWRLPSLSTPDESEFSPDDLLGFEATRLFCERAGQADPSFRANEQDARAIADICRRLDGIPLAIELAASRVRVLDAAEIGKRLDDRFRLLTGGSRTAMPRQQTLRATVDWSYELLDDTQRTLLARLSVFAGGWTLEAAETVCTDETVPPEDVLDVLSALVDRSLVVRDQTRFRLLDTIRHYAREKLVNSGEGADLRRRHMAHFAAVVAEFSREMRGPLTATLMELLDADLDNIRGAFDWALEEEPSTALRMTDSWWYFGCRGNWPELERWTTAALAATPDQQSAERAAALRSIAMSHVWAGDLERGFDVLKESLAMSRSLEDAQGTASALFMLTLFPATMGWSELALEYAKEALDHAHAFAIDILEADAKVVLAMLDPALDPDARLAVLEESASIYHRVGDYDNEANTHRRIGDIARGRRHFHEATRRYETALALSKQAGCHGCAAVTEVGLASLALGEGNLDAATERCRGPLRHFGRTRETLFLCMALGTAARIASERGEPATGARLLGACEALVQPTGFWAVAQRFMARAIARVRPNIDDTAFDEAFTAGRSMSADEAVALALEGLDRV